MFTLVPVATSISWLFETVMVGCCVNDASRAIGDFMGPLAYCWCESMLNQFLFSCSCVLGGPTVVALGHCRAARLTHMNIRSKLPCAKHGKKQESTLNT